MRKRTSIIWSFTNTAFIALINRHTSFANIIRELQLRQTGGNYKTLQGRIQEESVNIDHILHNKNKFTQVAIGKNTIPLEQILIENSTYTSGNDLKKRLLAAKLLINQCAECDQVPFWNNKPLILQLDHINGIHNDNRITNLRLLCPNCHTQTETFSGKHNKRKERKCIGCGKQIVRGSVRCNKCEANTRLKSSTA